MEGRQELTKEQRGAIIYSYQLKYTVRSIANHVGFSKTVMSNTIKRFQLGMAASRVEWPGQMMTSSSRDLKAMCDWMITF